MKKATKFIFTWLLKFVKFIFKYTIAIAFKWLFVKPLVLLHKVLGTFKSTLLAIALVVALYFGWSIPFYYGTGETENVQITRTMVKASPGEMKQIYLVWGKHLDTGKEEAFQVSDSWLFAKRNSSDRFGSLKEGMKYRVYVTGLRIPIFSAYRNIITVTPAS